MKMKSNKLEIKTVKWSSEVNVMPKMLQAGKMRHIFQEKCLLEMIR